MRTTTLRDRLALTMALLAVGVLAVASGAIYFGARRLLYRNLDNALLAIARIEVASAIDSPEGGVHVHDEGLALPIGSGYEKFAIIKRVPNEISASTANLHKGPPLEVDAELQDGAFRGQASFGNMSRGGQLYRAVYFPMRDNLGNPLVAIVAISQHPVQRSLQLLVVVLLGALLLGAGGVALVASRLAGHLTRPLERIAEAAREIGEDNRVGRIPDVSGDRELRAVTGILNDMLARLEAAFTTQRRFVADASHELRSPLGNLRGTVEVALRRPRTSEEYRETLETSLTEIDRLCRLVDDLLTLTRADAGQLRVDRQLCDLAQIAEVAVYMHGARAEAEGVELKLSAPAPLPVEGDVDRLRQVIDNLLDNALRYAPPRSAVEVVASREDGRALVSVHDCGAGLTAEDRAHVFDRFYRADSSRARHSGGLGLGLTIAKAVADAHAGELKVDSEVGNGSTFSLSLPLSLDEGDG
jgi:two-component system, OmpR family, sensor kinase